jgi:hypothetical protein
MQDLKTVRYAGTKVLPRGDLEMTVDSNGIFQNGPTFVSGPDKVVQDVVRGLLTQRGSVILARKFGTNLPSLLASRSLDDVATDLLSEVQYMLGYLSQFNISQPTNEQIATLVSLKANQNVGTIEMSMILALLNGQTVGVTL